MNEIRYDALQKGIIESLTPQEFEVEGWHFCHEWDGLLINPTWREHECCTCKTQEEIDKEENNAGVSQSGRDPF